MSSDRQRRIAEFRSQITAARIAVRSQQREEARKQKHAAAKFGESSSKKKAETTSTGGNDDDKDDEKTLKEGSGCNSPEDLKCSQCETWCTSLEEMEDHIARTHSDEPFICPYCDNFQCSFVTTMQVHLHEFHDVRLDE